MNCAHCNDTGSLSKNLHGYMDCAYCGVAEERVQVNIWADRTAPTVDQVDAWLIYQHGKTAAGQSTARGSMEQGSSA